MCFSQTKQIVLTRFIFFHPYILKHKYKEKRMMLVNTGSCTMKRLTHRKTGVSSGF